jgi:uncharacterized protein (DUF305 family)
MKKYLVFLYLFVFTLVSPAVLADRPVEGRIGRAEVRFMEGMIDHHQMAIDMANDCLAREDITDALRAECQSVVDTQQPEIEQMQAWLLEWYNVQYAPIPMSDTMGDSMEGMDHSGMDGMPYTDPAMMMGMMAGFNRLEGTEYEIAWLESMIDHHDDAIHMSERLLERDVESGGHPALRELAQNIINIQSEEITRYEGMIATMSSTSQHNTSMTS